MDIKTATQAVWHSIASQQVSKAVHTYLHEHTNPPVIHRHPFGSPVVAAGFSESQLEAVAELCLIQNIAIPQAITFAEILPAVMDDDEEAAKPTAKNRGLQYISLEYGGEESRTELYGGILNPQRTAVRSLHKRIIYTTSDGAPELPNAEPPTADAKQQYAAKFVAFGQWCLRAVGSDPSLTRPSLAEFDLLRAISATTPQRPRR